MGNHTDDCPDCGEDRRAHGSFACCEAEQLRRVEAKRAFLAEQEDRRALFDRLGIAHRQSPHYSGQFEVLPEINSLLAFLRTLP